MGTTHEFEDRLGYPSRTKGAAHTGSTWLSTSKAKHMYSTNKENIQRAEQSAQWCVQPAAQALSHLDIHVHEAYNMIHKPAYLHQTTTCKAYEMRAT